MFTVFFFCLMASTAWPQFKFLPWETNKDPFDFKFSFCIEVTLKTLHKRMIFHDLLSFRIRKLSVCPSCADTVKCQLTLSHFTTLTFPSLKMGILQIPWPRGTLCILITSSVGGGSGQALLTSAQVPGCQLRGVHGRSGCDGPADPGGGAASLQHRAAAARPLCVLAAPRPSGAQPLPPLHPAGPERGLHLPGMGGAGGVCARPLRGHHGLRLHPAPLPLPGGLQRGQLRPLPHHLHRHAFCRQGEESEVTAVTNSFFVLYGSSGCLAGFWILTL